MASIDWGITVVGMGLALLTGFLVFRFKRSIALPAPNGADRLGAVKQGVRRLLRNKMVLLMVGGAIGTYARYWLARWVGMQSWGQSFPYGTMIINVSGSFILGVAAIIILERLPPEHQGWYLLIGTGFCGGYTTFSTFEWETYKLVRDGSWGLALANVFGSVIAGFIGVLLAVALVQLIFPNR
jgi:CrcB protein